MAEKFTTPGQQGESVDPGGFPTSLPPHSASAEQSRKDVSLQQLCQEIVTMLLQHKAGVELRKLLCSYSKMYGRPLTLCDYDLAGLQELLGALGDQVSVERINNKNVVKANVDLVNTTSKPKHGLQLDRATKSGKKCKPSKKKGTAMNDLRGQETCQKVVALLLLHPEGVPVKMLAQVYSMRYKQNLTVAQLGYSSIPDFLSSLSAEIVVEGEVAHHRSNKPIPGPGGPAQNEGTQRPVVTPVINFWTPPQISVPGFRVRTPAAREESVKPRVPQTTPPAAVTPLPMSLSPSDFPKLVATAQGGAEPPRGAAVPVFTQAYHAQVRERHAGNMRAVDAQESIEKPAKRRNKQIVLEEADDLAEEFIRTLASEGELVTVEKVMFRLCRYYQVPYLPWNKPCRQLSALMSLERSISEVNMYIECTEAVNSINTLYELGQALAALKSKKHFAELHLGPLCKVPLIHKMFKVAATTKDDDIPAIETVDILRSLRAFRRRNNKIKVDLAEFMQHLADQYKCESPYALGIRIRGLGLPISTMQKAASAEHELMAKARLEIQQEIAEEVMDRMRKIKRSLLEPALGEVPYSSSGSLELRKRYATQTAAEAVLTVLANTEGVFSTRMTRHVQSFLMLVKDDRLATALFQLAICCGSLEAPRDLVVKEKPSKAGQGDEKPQQSERDSVLPPSEAAVKHYFQQCVSALPGMLTLPFLSKLEKKVTEYFRCAEFPQIKQGTFLEFLVKNSQILQEAAGGTLALNSQDSRVWGFKPSRQDVFEFIKQCGVDDQDRIPNIEHALRIHYKLRESRQLGYGQLSTLVSLVQQQKKLSDAVHVSPVRMEAALFSRECSATELGSVGLLGSVSREQALNCLLSVPLLEDLSLCSQWELVFQPEHGAVRDFIERHAGNSDLAALEVTPGSLLRISSSSSDRAFAEAVSFLDAVNTAGHLVSIAVSDGVTNAPAALLANHMESSLSTALAQEVGDTTAYGTVAKFILDCLARIPARFCKAFFAQVFLEPLSRALGQANSKAILLETARSEPRHLSALHHAGLLLGVTEWVKDFQSRLTAPKGLSDPPLTRTVQLRTADSPSMSSRSSAVDFSDEDGAEAVMEETATLSSPGDEDDDDKFELASIHNDESRGSSESPVDTSGGAVGGQTEDEKEEVAALMGQRDEDVLSQRRAVIEDIRKSEFGIGVELNEEGLNLMKVHQERLGRSLDRLSAELYSKDTHFVLELIQNADDNSYPQDDGVQPALAFVVDKDCVTILNNECGFEERNIRAICDVGRSTKGKHKYGYIGQKGIGFKSVFKVTNCPEIHSNGFHIRFDKNSGPMGYIQPHWCGEERFLNTHGPQLGQHKWTTQISLPLRSESYQTRNLFHDVHPSLLLFLHRLRSITIVNQSEKRLVSMTRRDLSHNVLEVEHTDGVERWLVVKRTLCPEKIKDDVESTELALAFRLNDSSSPSSSLQPEKQPVFAFLPLRSFGFRFIIQGDFDIPSSREDVDRDSRWNQWLRSEIPRLFLHAMDVFAEHPEFSGLQGLCNFLKFIPLSDELLDFFQPVAGQILQLLKGKACLPTWEHDEGVVQLKQPSQLAVSHDPLIQEVIGSELLQKHLNLSYLHPAVQSALPAHLLSALGVHRLRAANIATITRAMAKDIVQANGTLSEACLKKVAMLLVCNFRAVEQDYSESDSVLQTLKDIPIIPLADGRMTALNGGGVFFPLPDAKSTHTGLEGLYKDLCTVTPQLLDCLDPLGNSLVLELLKRLDVHELEPQKVLQEHIYPILRSGAWKNKSKDIVISYVVFIKQHSGNQDYRSVNASIPVLTNKGFVCPTESKVQFAKEYGNIDLPTKLPGVDWVLLDTCYLTADMDPNGWREFFSALGVRDLLIFRKERRHMSSTQMASSPWAGEQWPRVPDDLYVVEGYECEEFCTLLQADRLDEKQKQAQTQELLQLLDTNWVTGENYSQYLKAQVQDSQGRALQGTRSSFHHLLTHTHWVPTIRTQPDSEGRRSVDYLPPSSVYLYSEQLHMLLGRHVSYLVSVSPSEFTNSTGMKHSLSVEDLISHLKTWCTEAQQKESQSKSFTTTMDHIHHVYHYLSENLLVSRLKELFQQVPAVFIPCDRDGEWCTGKFYPLKEVCWSDPTNMFCRYKAAVRTVGSEIQQPRMLAPHYGKLCEFFLQNLAVERLPSLKQYVDLLELVCSTAPPTGDLLQDVSVLYAKLAEKCKVPYGDQEHSNPLNISLCASLKGMLTDRKVFPSKSHNWVSLSHSPLIPDNKTLEKLFRPHRQVCLLNLPAAEKKLTAKPRNGPARENLALFNEADRDLFLEICGVKKLSDCVSTEAQTENYRPCAPAQALVRQLVPYAQLFLFKQRDTYCELKDSNISHTIRSLTFGQVGKLYIQYELNVPNEEPIFEREDVICLLKDSKEFYIQKDHLTAKLDICREVAKLFLTDERHRKELTHFLTTVLSYLDDADAMKRFLRAEDVEELPDEEERWEVPEPVEIRPEPPAPRWSRQEGVAEERRPEPQDGEETLMCWPPKSSMHTSTSSHSDSAQVVEAVMKMWPPPPGPDGESTQAYRSGGHSESGSSEQGMRTSTPQPATNAHHRSAPHIDKSEDADAGSGRRHHEQCQERSVSQREEKPGEQQPEGHHPAQNNNTHEHKPGHHTAETNPPSGSGVISGTFHGTTCVPRSPLPLDNPVWSQQLSLENVEENVPLTCSLPSTVVFTEGSEYTAQIGKWGEELVHAFLTHWRDSGAPGRPSQVTWCNEEGESGVPYDFRLTFASQDGSSVSVFVEVKATAKAEKSFIRLSANEVDLALKEKERYHVYRVYNAGDSQNVQLCRYTNLAQSLHSKQVELFVFL